MRAQKPPIEVSLGSVGQEFEMGGVHLSGVLGAGGNDVSPRVAWGHADDLEVRSYALTVHDPDAPTSSGFWHWVVFDIPAHCRELPEGAGTPGATGGPAGCIEARNDAGYTGYVGAAPPVGHGPHRYFFRVHAVSVPSLGLTPDASPAMVEFTIGQYEIARGHAMVKYEACP